MARRDYFRENYYAGIVRQVGDRQSFDQLARLRYIDDISNPNYFINRSLFSTFYRDKIYYDNFVNYINSTSTNKQQSNIKLPPNGLNDIYKNLFLDLWERRWEEVRNRVRSGELITKTELDRLHREFRREISYLQKGSYGDFINEIKNPPYSQNQRYNWNKINEIFLSWEYTGGIYLWYE